VLVLSRTKDQSIIIGDHIKIMVIEVRGDKVRLGVEAPKDVAVHREEVYEAIKREHGTPNATGTADGGGKACDDSESLACCSGESPKCSKSLGARIHERRGKSEGIRSVEQTAESPTETASASGTDGSTDFD
jgi:carbon storage regulator